MEHGPVGATAVNQPEVVAEISRVFAAYETALRLHDVAALNASFWNHPSTVRYGIGEHSLGYDGIAAYRSTATPVHPDRELHGVIITTFGSDVASVCCEFTAPDSRLRGRQSQTWVRFVDGWKIVAAHVSTVEPEKLNRF